MSRIASKTALTVWALAGISGMALVACNADLHSNLEFEDSPSVGTGARELKYEVLESGFSEDWYPCSMCHSEEDEVDTNPHLIEMHEDIELNHGPDRWCLDCHSTHNRDFLRLINGTEVAFEEAYKLCGQCHQSIYKDWEVGVHGKSTGSWDENKQIYTCTGCHNPHSPKFPPLEPRPAPIKQEAIR